MLQHRLAEESSTKTENQKVYDRWQELKSMIRSAVNDLKAIRPEIDELMASGEFVGYPDAYLTLQEKTVLSADMDALVADLGPEIALRVATVDSTKLRKLIDAGVIKEDSPYITKNVTSSLVTKTERR